jgi:hypothetical protein
MSASSDPISLELSRHEEICRSIAHRVEGLEGPITAPAERYWIADRVTKAASITESLLHGVQSPLYTTSTTWVHWTPVDRSDRTLEQLAQCCRVEAQTAIEEWRQFIESRNAPPEVAERASRALWRSQQLYCHLLVAAGVNT